MSRLIYAAYFLAAGLACLVIGAVMLRVHVQLGRRLSKHPRADALMALHPHDFEAFVRGVGMLPANQEWIARAVWHEAERDPAFVEGMRAGLADFKAGRFAPFRPREAGWTRSLDELPDPFAEAFGDA